MIDWDDVLSTIQMQGKSFEIRKIGKRLYFQCETYEAAEIVRKALKEKGLVITAPGTTDVELATSQINWDNIIILPEG